jgi:hypothetical protein
MVIIRRSNVELLLRVQDVFKSSESLGVTTLMSQHTAVEMTSVAGVRVGPPRSIMCLRSKKAQIDFDSWSSAPFAHSHHSSLSVIAISRVMAHSKRGKLIIYVDCGNYQSALSKIL